MGYSAETERLQSGDSGFGDDEPVADAGLRLDRYRRADLGRQLGTEPLHVHVDGAVAASHRVAPDPAVEDVAAKSGSFALGKSVEHVALSLRQGQAPAVPGGFATLGIDAERAQGDGSLGPRGSLRERSHPRGLLPRAHATVQNLVGAGGEE